MLFVLGASALLLVFRPLRIIAGLFIVGTLIYFGAGFHEWKQACADHSGNPAYVAYHNCP